MTNGCMRRKTKSFGTHMEISSDERIAALASSVVASMAMRLPCNKPRSASKPRTQENTS